MTISKSTNCKVRRRKVTDDELRIAEGKWLAKVDAYIIRKAMKYLNAFYRDMRKTAMRKTGKHVRFDKSARMKASHLQVGIAGGILPYSKDEIIPFSNGLGVHDLHEYIERTGNESNILIEKWRQEAEQTVRYPAILRDYEPDDGVNLDQFLVSPPDSLMARFVGTGVIKKHDCSDWDLDGEPDENQFAGIDLVQYSNDVSPDSIYTGDSMATIDELEKQKQDIEAKIAEQKAAGRSDALEQVKKLIKQYEMTATELKSVIKKRKKRATGTATARKPAAKKRASTKAKPK